MSANAKGEGHCAIRKTKTHTLDLTEGMHSSRLPKGQHASFKNMIAGNLHWAADNKQHIGKCKKESTTTRKSIRDIFSASEGEKTLWQSNNMADIAVDGLKGGYVPVLYTSKTKAVIDFWNVFFYYYYFFWCKYGICTHRISWNHKVCALLSLEEGGGLQQGWRSKGREGSLLLTLPLTNYNIFLFSNSCREQGRANRGQTNMIGRDCLQCVLSRGLLCS